ncbi:MAG: hypothetical protein ACRENE_31755 [Polyangiaceae bacterium]
MRGREVTVLVCASLAYASGCVQVLGLEGYEPEDAGADGSTDVTVGGETGAVTDSGTAGEAVSPEAGRSTDAGRPSDAADAGGSHDAADAGRDAPLFAPDACSGATTCAPAPPSGWQGPVALWEGSGSPPPCSAFYLSLFNGGTSPTAPAGSCGCSCSPPTGATCGPVKLQPGGGTCSSGCGSDGGVVASQGTCTPVSFSGCGTGAGFAVTGSIAAGGACEPDAAGTLPAPTWATQAIACVPSSQSPLGCPPGEQCVPVASTPFEPHFCVLMAGTNPCPAGPYSVQHLYYGAFKDNRSCPPCTCSAPSGIDCNSSGSVTTGSSGTCHGTTAMTSLSPGACIPIAGVASVQVTTAPTGGSCMPDGGQPTGTVTPQGSTTICCTP